MTQDPTYQPGSIFEKMLQDPELRRKVQSAWAKSNEDARQMKRWAQAGFTSEEPPEPKGEE